MSGAHTNHDSDFPTENISGGDVPIYSQPELPETGYIPLVVEQYDPSCGADLLALYHLPISRVTPGGTFQTNTYSLASNGGQVVVPNNQVVPAYVQQNLPNMIIRADGSDALKKAKFLVLGEDPNDSDRYIIQNSGVYSFETNHNYVIGFTYYLSDTNPGQVVTVPPATNPQALFFVVDQKTILVHIGE